MKTGSGGRPWIELESPKPPPVQDEQSYWMDAPPEPSERCRYWVRQIEAGWMPNRSVSGNGYHGSAVWYGVWIWEYLNVLYPLIESKRGRHD
ncbi:hypothetical protein HQO42_14920 [Rhodococcus fascians]|nr:hypothetical protein [Rhodococcus fascians]MBY4237747.1 hypothetical protein [Rhodococcus fascians]MBY4253950.1 hypothetical protein [Rhodococcus fascians]MBY4269179.1 hypothetical protein [Rhodococcus fascians]